MSQLQASMYEAVMSKSGLSALGFSCAKEVKQTRLTTSASKNSGNRRIIRDTGTSNCVDLGGPNRGLRTSLLPPGGRGKHLACSTPQQQRFGLELRRFS